VLSAWSEEEGLFDFRKDILNFVESLRISGPEYRFSPTSGSSLYTSCFALFIIELLDEVKGLRPSLKREWIDYINSHQIQESGYYKFGGGISWNDSNTHKPDYLKMQMTSWALQALDVLGGRPRYPLKFMEDFCTVEKLGKWLEARDWSDPWYEGNMLLFMGVFLIDCYEKGIHGYGELIDYYIDWLNKKQNESTGYWGINLEDRDNLFNAMAGATHEYILYYYLNRSINYIEKIIDSTLSLQHKDGLFSPRGGGGACEDLDAVDILVNMSLRTDYKKEEIKNALLRAFHALKGMQNDDGGFVYRRNFSFCMSGLRRISSKPNESDLFSTWFRLYTIAIISQVIDIQPYSSFNWSFLKYPGMGMFRKYED
jgi:hypothetical protein